MCRVVIMANRCRDENVAELFEYELIERRWRRAQLLMVYLQHALLRVRQMVQIDGYLTQREYAVVRYECRLPTKNTQGNVDDQFKIGSEGDVCACFIICLCVCVCVCACVCEYFAQNFEF